ncbi:DNA methylase family protein [Peptostreptococcaceae bacterium AS15]|nr:DNA methylase family protein [Peptostreptococcaceae bacterium AS15]
MDKMKMETVDMTAQNIDKIATLFPNCISEMLDEEKSTDDKKVYKKAVNFDLLKQMLSGDVIEGDEAYEFTWVGKRASIVEANKPIRKTLRPCIEESVNWDNTENLYIEGDNLEVLKLLQESYLGKVKMIYIDPPYNTGNDFIYNDDFKMSRYEYSDELGEYDDDGNRLFKNTESNGRFHSDWCSMIYPRLMLARNLLSDDGVIFISIDDNEQENLKKICDEVFGAENFVAQIIWKKKQGGGNDSNYVVSEHEYIICFCKSINSLFLGLDKKYKLDDSLYPFSDEKGEYGLITLDKSSLGYIESLDFEIKDKDGNSYYPRNKNGEKKFRWRWSKSKVEKEFENLVFKKGKVYTKYYRPEGITPKSLLIESLYGRTESGNDDIKKIFNNLNPFFYPKPLNLINHFISIGTRKDDIILDFFSGSRVIIMTVANSIINTRVLKLLPKFRISKINCQCIV